VITGEERRNFRIELISTRLLRGCISRSLQLIGFDLLLVDALLHENAKFFTAVECRFSKKDEKGKLSSRTLPQQLAKKVCDSLKEYPCLVTALIENRFCFVFASFQDFSEKETFESMADLILVELTKKKGKTNMDKVSFAKKEKVTRDLLLGCLIIFRRKHLEALLTPTLKDRYHFFKPEVNE
jgi:hypothetical protein